MEVFIQEKEEWLAGLEEVPHDKDFVIDWGSLFHHFGLLHPVSHGSTWAAYCGCLGVETARSSNQANCRLVAGLAFSTNLVQGMSTFISHTKLRLQDLVIENTAATLSSLVEACHMKTNKITVLSSIMSLFRFNTVRLLVEVSNLSVL